MSLHFHQAVIGDVRRETADCISVAFAIADQDKELFKFLPGQNITVRALIDGEDLRRSYSICSAPHEHELRIAVKEIPGGKFSAWANKELKKGHSLELLPPTGRFTIRTNQPPGHKHYLAIAAGSGITPVISMISEVLAVEPGSRFTLLYGNRNRSTIIFRERLEALKNNYMQRFALHHVLSREAMDTDIYAGRINAAKCEEMQDKVIDFDIMDDIFLCGPEQMIFEIKDWLLSRGIAVSKVHFELFTTPVSALPADNEKFADVQRNDIPRPATSNVTVKVDGTSYSFELAFDGDTILEAALDAGADLPFSCKGGVCSTCRAKVVEGEVEMELNYALEPEEVAAGFVLCCQSRPVSEKVIIDYDQK